MLTYTSTPRELWKQRSGAFDSGQGRPWLGWGWGKETLNLMLKLKAECTFPGILHKGQHVQRQCVF